MYLAPRNIPSAAVLTFGSKVVLAVFRPGVQEPCQIRPKMSLLRRKLFFLPSRGSELRNPLDAEILQLASYLDPVFEFFPPSRTLVS